MTSLRARLALTTALLALIALSLITLAGIRAYADWQQAKALGQAASIQTELTRGVVAMSLERSLVQVTGGLADPIAPPFRKLLDEQRRKADAHLDRAATELAQLDQPSAQRVVAVLTDTRQNIAALRVRADAELAKAGGDRDRAFLAQWPRVFPAAIERLESLRLQLRAAEGQLPAVVVTLSDVAHYAWRIRELGGRERTYYALASARGLPLTDAEKALASVLAARVQSSFGALDDLESAGTLTATLKADLATLRSLYIGSDYARAREAYLAGQIPLPFDALFSLSQTALDAAVTASDRAALETLGFWQNEVSGKQTTLVGLAVAGVVVLLIAAWALWVAVFRVGQRLMGMEALMRRLAGGDLAIDVGPFKAGDEVGRMAGALDVFRVNALRLHELMAQLRQTAQQLAVVSGGLARVATDLDQRSAQQTDAAASMSAGMEELSSSLTQVADSAGEADRLAHSSDEEARSGALVINGVVQQIASIESTVTQAATDIEALRSESDQIRKVIQVISEIAGQTNLLALNAAIEAARAGEQGRGFAVVADEVRQLAEKTRLSTDQITSTIAAMLDHTEAAVDRMREGVTLVEQGSRQAREVSGVVDRLRNASQQVESAVGQISTALGEQRQVGQTVSQSVEQVARMTEEARIAASEARALSGQLDLLARQIAQQLDQPSRAASA